MISTDKLLEKHDSSLQRILEIIPGLLTWVVITSPIWLGKLLPFWMAFFLTWLSVFWVYRAFMHTAGLIIGYYRYQREIKQNWLEKCRNLNFSQLPNAEQLPEDLDHIYHLILIPAVNEGFEVLEGTFKAIAESNYLTKNIFIALTVEERGAETVGKSFRILEERYKETLGGLFMYVHPANIAGEAKGAAAANRTWGGRHAVEDLKKKGIPTKHTIFTTFDADGRVHQEFIARLTYAYLTDGDRLDRFYQTACYLFDNNIWDVPILMRIQASSLSMAILSSWVFEPERKDTFSAYSVPLETVIETGYWDTKLGVDDTPFFWRTFLRKDGNFSGKEFYIPLYSDAVQGTSVIKSHISQYKQLLRWGWGIIVFPIAVKGFLTNKKIKLLDKLIRIYRMIEQYTVWYTIAFLITFGFMLFHTINPKVEQTTLGAALPKITGYVLTGAFFLLLPIGVFREKLTPPKPAQWSWWRKTWATLEGPLVIINLLTFTLIPYIDAATRLMLNKRLELWFTPKVRPKENSK